MKEELNPLKGLDEEKPIGTRSFHKEVIKSLLRIVGAIAIFMVGWVFGLVKENNANEIIKDAQKQFDARYVQHAEFMVLKEQVTQMAGLQAQLIKEIDENNKVLSELSGNYNATIKSLDRAIEKLEKKYP